MRPPKNTAQFDCYHPKMRATLIVVAGLALLAGSCGGSTRANVQSTRQTTAEAATVKPGDVSTPSSEPTTSTRACGQPGSDERAPFAQSVSFIDGRNAFLLGRQGNRAGVFECAYLAQTTDGGQTWTKLPDTGLMLPRGESAVQDSGTVSGIEFATPQRGWLYGPGLWATHNGGLTWQLESRASAVNSVVLSGDDGWAFESVPCGSGRCAEISVASEANAWQWKPLSAQPPAIPGLEPVKLLRPTSRHALISFVDSRGAFGNGALVATEDGGVTWAVTGALPRGRLGLTDVAAFGEHDIWLTYGGGPATIMQAKEIFHSDDGGGAWQLIADAGIAGNGGQLNNLPVSGYIPRITISSPTALFLSLGRSTLHASFDGGRTWAPVIDDEGARGGADSVQVLGFGDALHGFATSSSARWVTADGGHTWLRVTLPG